MAHYRCNYSQCTPCFKEWVQFVMQRQSQSAKVPGTNIRVRISEQTSIKPETPDEGYKLVYSKKPECQAVISERDRIAAECEPRPRNEARVNALARTVNEQLKRGQCTVASRTVQGMQRLMSCERRKK